MKKADEKRKPMHIQSLIFSKDHFSSEEAKSWASKHGYNTGVDETGDSYRMRQVDPGKFSKMRTIELTTGVKAVVGKGSPTSSQVHVPSTGEEDKIVVKSRNGTTVEITKGVSQEMVDEAHEEIDSKTEKDIEYDTACKWAARSIAAMEQGQEDLAEDFAHEALEHAALVKDGGITVQAIESVLRDSGIPMELEQADHGDIEKDMLDSALPPTPAPTPHPRTPELEDETDPHSPGIDNLDAGIDKSIGGDGENSLSGLQDMQSMVEGTDYEMAENQGMMEDDARDQAINNLEKDPDYYRKKRMEDDWTSDALYKDTSQEDEDPFAGEGLCLDLGSGNAREPGHIGLDTYPYDHGTVVHDLNMGLPFPDESVRKVQMINSLHDEQMPDPKAMLSEIHRVLMPGGQFVYEGPEDIYNYPKWAQDFPGLVMINHEDNEPIEKIEGVPAFRQQFTRLAVPDSATANDAEPRIGIAQYDMLPADALLAMDAIGYDWSDSTSSGKGNKLLGYPTQGALVERAAKSGWFKSEPEGEEGEFEDDVDKGGGGSAGSATESNHLISEGPMWKKVGKISKVEKVLKSGKLVPILKLDKHKQIVYGVVLEPNTIDAQEDYMEPEEIEKAAHRYLSKSRVIGSGHEKPVDAEPVESFIAPQDFDVNGQYGPQPVKKGSWVLGVKIHDPEEWQKVLDGDYTGFSVGGMGLRDQQ